MSPVPLTSIPVELLQRNSELLDQKTLKNVGLVDNICNLVAKPYIVQRICISIISQKQLKINLAAWNSKLEQTSAFTYVRYLEIDEYMPPKQEDVGELREYLDRRNAKNNVDHVYEPSVWVVEKDPWYPVYQDNAPPEQCLSELSACQPLAILIASLTRLRDLVYACSNQFSPCLLLVVRQYLPQCKLHLRTFHFCSLR